MLSLITLSITVNIAMMSVTTFLIMLTIVMLSAIRVCHNAEVNYTQYKVKKCYTKCHDFAHNAKCYHAGYH